MEAAIQQRVAVHRHAVADALEGVQALAVGAENLDAEDAASLQMGIVEEQDVPLADAQQVGAGRARGGLVGHLPLEQGLARRVVQVEPAVPVLRLTRLDEDHEPPAGAVGIETRETAPVGPRGRQPSAVGQYEAKLLSVPLPLVAPYERAPLRNVESRARAPLGARTSLEIEVLERAVGNAALPVLRQGHHALGRSAVRA